MVKERMFLLVVLLVMVGLFLLFLFQPLAADAAGDCRTYHNHSDFIPERYDHAHLFERGYDPVYVETDGEDVRVPPPEGRHSWDTVKKCKTPSTTTTTLPETTSTSVTSTTSTLPPPPSTSVPETTTTSSPPETTTTTEPTDSTTTTVPETTTTTGGTVPSTTVTTSSLPPTTEVPIETLPETGIEDSAVPALWASALIASGLVAIMVGYRDEKER